MSGHVLKKTDTLITSRPAISPLEARLRRVGMVDIQSLDSNIRVDLKYSSSDNFLGIDVYGDMEKAYLLPEVAEKLVNAQQNLKKEHPDFNLIVFDAVRPLSLQKVFWDSIKVPAREKGKYVSNPWNGGSLHNFGAAVDVSIVDSHDQLLDMGTDFDFFGELAYPSHEQEFLLSGELSQQQFDNRKLLRSVMNKAGFWNIQTEWWHFVSCSLEQAKQQYQIVE